LVRANEAIKIRSLEVQSPVEWTRFSAGRKTFWTMDGPALNQIQFYVDIKDREHIFLETRNRRERKGEGVLFRAQMSEAEVVDLIGDALAEEGLASPKLEKLEPARFAGLKGFGFELSFATERGLKYRAIGIGEVQDQTLSFAVYFAPSEYFFERNRRDAEAVFASIRLR
jgi:hypothetical protein